MTLATPARPPYNQCYLMWVWWVMDVQWIQTRIATVKQQIEAYDDALIALSSGVTSYTLNTGQSVQTVTRAQAPQLQQTVNGLYNLLATLEARLTGSNVVRVAPKW